MIKLANKRFPEKGESLAFNDLALELSYNYYQIILNPFTTYQGPF